MYFSFLMFCFFTFFSISAFAQALPTETPSSRSPNVVGKALSKSIKNAMTRRGFTANDNNPRLSQTLRSLNKRTVASVASRASWLKYMGRLNPWVGGAFLVAEGYEWLTSSDGMVQTRSVPSVRNIPGVTQGRGYWVSGNVSGSDPYFVALQAAVLRVGPSKWSLHSFEYSHAYEFRGYDREVYSADYRSASCPSGGCLSRSVIAEHHPEGAEVTCPAGFYGQSWDCVPYDFREDGAVFLDDVEVVTPSQTYEQAYEALPQAVKDGDLSPSALAEFANRLWRDAASQPDFDGVPFSNTHPVTEDDFVFRTQEGPENWPKVSDLAQPIPTSNPMEAPTQSPLPNGLAQPVPSPDPLIRVDFGPDPDTKSPELEQPPTDLFGPIKQVLQPWLTWDVPAHAGACPTWRVSPAVSGQVFDIDVSDHCRLMEEHRASVQSVSLAAWMAVAAFVVLSA